MDNIDSIYWKQRNKVPWIVISIVCLYRQFWLPLCHSCYSISKYPFKLVLMAIFFDILSSSCIILFSMWTLKCPEKNHLINIFGEREQIFKENSVQIECCSWYERDFLKIHPQPWTPICWKWWNFEYKNFDFFFNKKMQNLLWQFVVGMEFTRVVFNMA